MRRPGRWGREGPPPDPALHRGSAAGAALEAALGPSVDAAALEPVCTSVVTRRRVEVESSGARIEIAFDQGTIRAGTASLPVCELEYELKSGDAGALVEFARAAVAAHGVWLCTESKAARGDRLARGEEAAAATASAPRLERSMRAAEIVKVVMRACFDHVAANAGTIANGGRDAETIHQLRVGLRRMRTASRELAALSADLPRAWEVAAADAFCALGVWRDRETVAQSLHDRLVAAGSPQPLLSTASDDPPDPVACVRAEGFQCAMLDVLGFVLQPARGADDDARATVDPLHEVAARLTKLQRRLKRGSGRFERLDEAAQHRVRKRLKQLRYLAELVGPLYDAAAVERYVKRLRPAQDALGAHVDLLVGCAMAREAAGRGDAAAWFNVGWLRAQLPASAKRCRNALARAAKARAFW